MVFTVECGVDFTLSFGDIDQKFYHTIASIYEQALKHIVDNQLEDKFVGRWSKLGPIKREQGIYTSLLTGNCVQF